MFLQVGFNLLAVRLPRFVLRQDVFLRLAVHHVVVVISQVDWLYPVTGVINHHWAPRSTQLAINIFYRNTTLLLATVRRLDGFPIRCCHNFLWFLVV